MQLEWYHLAGAGVLYWLWRKQQEETAAAAAAATAAGLGATHDQDAESQAGKFPPRDQVLAAGEDATRRFDATMLQNSITTETNGAVAGTVRTVLPPAVNAAPRVITNSPVAAENEALLARDANSGAIRVVPKEGSQSIARDTTYGHTPTAQTAQNAQALPYAAKQGMVVSEDLDDLRNLRATRVLK